jgi:hypothetical protein
LPTARENHCSCSSLHAGWRKQFSQDGSTWNLRGLAGSELFRPLRSSFDKAAKGKIAIKVINHYGDEVLKVFDVA